MRYSTKDQITKLVVVLGKYCKNHAFCKYNSDLPPISAYETSGFSSACNIAMLLSASGGNISTKELECLWRATDAFGFSNSRSIVLKMRT